MAHAAKQTEEEREVIKNQPFDEALELSESGRSNKIIEGSIASEDDDAEEGGGGPPIQPPQHQQEREVPKGKQPQMMQNPEEQEYSGNEDDDDDEGYQVNRIYLNKRQRKRQCLLMLTILLSLQI